MVKEMQDIKKSYRKVEETPVFILAHALTLKIYKLTIDFPGYEIYGLGSQIRRSASSIPANIAEGYYRNSTKELLQFLYNARGSYGETLYHLLLAKDLSYISNTEYENMVNEYHNLGKQLNGWIKALKEKL
jgi:four helix bundle protein